MRTRYIHFALITGTVFFFSCNNLPSQSHGAIRLGDSATIVTEKDPDKLKDLVTDLQPAPATPENKDTVVAKAAEPPKDTAKKTAAPDKPKTPVPPPAPDIKGLKAEFNELTVLLPAVEAKLSGNPNLQRANGAVYTLVSGIIEGNLLKLTGNVTKVSQRYQSIVVVKNDIGILPLETLTTTTSWEPLKGANSIYRIVGLDTKSLEAADGNRNTIRNAVTKAAQRRRMSRRKIEEWVESVHNVRATDQKPLTTMLRSVMWKIDGKDANGKMFSKQIRIDIPM